VGITLRRYYNTVGEGFRHESVTSILR